MAGLDKVVIEMDEETKAAINGFVSATQEFCKAINTWVETLEKFDNAVKSVGDKYSPKPRTLNAVSKNSGNYPMDRGVSEL